MKNIMISLVLLTAFNAYSQQTLTLDECQKLLSINYPLIQQISLLEKQNESALEAIQAEKLPRLFLEGFATYQSDVIEIPIPDSGVEPPNKDQYRASFTLNQLIYGGGLIDANADLKTAGLKKQQKQVEVSMYQLKKEVNRLYFSILLITEKNKLLEAKRNQIVSKLAELKSGIKNGVILPSSDKVLEAELLKINQQFVETEANKKILVNTLSSLIGRELGNQVNFQLPEIPYNIDNQINRPELELFALQKEEINSSETILSKQNSPQLFGFATGGYGNPGLDVLDNSFQAFYITGVKLSWNVYDWNANKKKREALAINKDIVDNEAQIFKLNTSIELDRYLTDIAKIETFIRDDQQIIDLQKEVLMSTESQLRNGVITSSAYIIDLTNLYEAENMLNTHKIELLLVKANYKTTKGN